MKTLFIFLTMFVTDAIACSCEFGCSNRSYDIVAVIEITEKHPDYLQAYSARIERLQDFSPIYSLEEKSVEAFPKDIIVVDAGSGVRLRDKALEPGELEEIIVRGCGYSYHVGDKIHFFGNRVQEGFYETTTCSCTTRLD